MTSRSGPEAEGKKEGREELNYIIFYSLLFYCLGYHDKSGAEKSRHWFREIGNGVRFVALFDIVALDISSWFRR